MMKIFDVHAHYDDDSFKQDFEELLVRIKAEGVYAVVNNATDVESSREGVLLSEKYDFIYSAAGVHPQNADKAYDGFIDELKDIALNNKKVVAIGEAGLDYHWKDVDRETQIPVFEAQLALANELDMPIIIHDREAHADTLGLIKKYRPKGFLHCYSGSVEMMREAVGLGLSISLGGVVTFKNARQTLEVASQIPLEFLLLETDAPYLAPEPFRGKRCDSSMIRYTAEKIASLRGMTAGELLEITNANAERMFGLSLVH